MWMTGLVAILAYRIVFSLFSIPESQLYAVSCVDSAVESYLPSSCLFRSTHRCFSNKQGVELLHEQF